MPMLDTIFIDEICFFYSSIFSTMLHLLARLPTRTPAVAGRALQRRNMAGSTWEYALKHGHHPVRSRDSRTRFLFLSLPAPALVSSLRPARCSQPPLSAPRNAASFSFNTCARLRSRTPSHYHPIALPPPHTHSLQKISTGFVVFTPLVVGISLLQWSFRFQNKKHGFDSANPRQV